VPSSGLPNHEIRRLQGPRSEECGHTFKTVACTERPSDGSCRAGGVERNEQAGPWASARRTGSCARPESSDSPPSRRALSSRPSRPHDVQGCRLGSPRSSCWRVAGKPSRPSTRGMDPMRVACRARVDSSAKRTRPERDLQAPPARPSAAFSPGMTPRHASSPVIQLRVRSSATAPAARGRPKRRQTGWRISAVLVQVCRCVPRAIPGRPRGSGRRLGVFPGASNPGRRVRRVVADPRL